MKKIAALFACFLMAGSLYAQDFFGDFFFNPFGERKPSVNARNEAVTPVVDLDLYYLFDNREFAASSDAYTPSMTNHGVRVSPMVGVQVRQNRYVSHRVMCGGMLQHNMGVPAGLANNSCNVLMFYNAEVGMYKGIFDATVGIFQRTGMEGEYSEAFFSDSLKFHDPDLEGVLLKWKAPKMYAEIGLDWMGKKDYDVKERFQVFSAGKWSPAKWLSLGWAASMYHYAGSVIAPGVVDNQMVNPYVKLDLASALPLQELSLKAGMLATYQWDRKFDDTVHFPCGGEFVLCARYANVTFKDTFYSGGNLLYYYSGHDAAGHPYGNNLYRGSPFYRGTYNLAELGWTPLVTDYLDISFNLRFHYGEGGYYGCQQVFSLLFNLDKARRNPTKAPAVRKAISKPSTQYAL